jgi:fucose 4-O-acetylase-like acetyltransferase
LPWGIDRICKYIGFYMLGNLLAERVNAQTLANKPRWKIGLGGILLLANFWLAFWDLTQGIRWFVTASLGILGVMLISMAIDHNRGLQYFGRISLVILCVHGPIYRILIKVAAILMQTSTENVRANFMLMIITVIVTMAISALLYEAIVRIAPWMIGKSKRGNSIFDLHRMSN